MSTCFPYSLPTRNTLISASSKALGNLGYILFKPDVTFSSAKFIDLQSLPEYTISGYVTKYIRLLGGDAGVMVITAEQEQVFLIFPENLEPDYYEQDII